jgi:hypothetical protein
MDVQSMDKTANSRLAGHRLLKIAGLSLSGSPK